MERMMPQADKARTQMLQDHANHSTGLLRALAGCCIHHYAGSWREALWTELRKLYRKPLNQLSADEFLCQELESAFTTLAGKELAEKLPELIALRLEGQFSNTAWRRSYRSKQFSYYFGSAVELLYQLIRESCYPHTQMERLSCTETFHGGYEYLLALEIRRGNQEIITALHETILGENTQILLTRGMIRAVVISGHEGLLDDLLKLLLAAKLQEGLRQQILEAADCGKTKVLCRILKVCIDNQLFRFSGADRAFETWTGLAYGASKANHIQKYALLAYDCLSDEAKRQQYYQSDNNVEAYFALWAQGCQEIESTRKPVMELLEDPRHYRRVLGWLFVSGSDSRRYQMELASRYLEERDEELLAWITQNLAQAQTQYLYGAFTNYRAVVSSSRDPAFPDSKEERLSLFRRLEDLGAYIGNKKRSFTGNPFEFTVATLDNERVYGCMIGLACYDMDRELIDALVDLTPKMSVPQRQMLVRSLLQPNTNAKHRAFLHTCLSDRSAAVRDLAVAHFDRCGLTQQDVDVLVDGLRSKSSGLRSGILSVLKKQSLDLLRPLIPQMLNSVDENQNQAAIELLIELKEKDPGLLPENRAALEALRCRKISTQTKILMEQLPVCEKEEVIFSAENGFGLYDPKVVEEYASGLDEPKQKKGFLSRIFDGGALMSARQIKALIPTEREMDKLLERVDQVFTRHADTEIEVEIYSGNRQKRLFGDTIWRMALPVNTGCSFLHEANARLDMIPFWEEFREALGEYATDVKKMLGLFHLVCQTVESDNLSPHSALSPWYQPIHALGLAPMLYEKCRSKYGRIMAMVDIFNHLPKIFDPHEVFTEVVKIYRSAIAIMGEDNLLRSYVSAENVPQSLHRIPALGFNNRMLSTWRSAIHQLKLNTEDFAQWFSLQYRLERMTDATVIDRLKIEDYFRAFQEKIIPRDVLMAFLLDGKIHMPYKIRSLTRPTRWVDSRNLYEQYDFARDLIAQILERAVTVEEKRGELPTPLTGHCLSIERFEGAEHFCNLLAALGKENFFRGYEYSHNETKQAVLSRLLKRCYPAKDDTPGHLAALLKKTDISESRLVEAVMYAPQWAGFAEKILQWPGLKCGVWFFHAHINETFSAEKETETAIYSPISPQQFNDGAFDRNWFFEAYEQLGEQRFQILYKSAKYITSGSNQHRRSQLYADAVLGKLDAQELLQEIVEKRNQEKLRCYPLIPIADNDSGEALHRYEFIQKYLKESKQFGAQRRDSEKKACTTALENLAITTGLADVNRLMWQMESQKIRQIEPLMKPKVLDGISLWLSIDKSGTAEICMEKSGKKLKTAPKSIAKNEAYLELKDTVKELKDLKQRSRESMERAMMECTQFGAEELKNVCDNPVLAPMVFGLVWTDGVNCGFLQQSVDGLVLVKPDGVCIKADALRIAHPHDLKSAGNWIEFMQLLYEKRLVQPFKQVFREYYPLSEDELQERTLSRRYAGHQVQPQRTVALLKGRGWTVDYEEGLQKVFYKENLIVRMYAMADWFSPADIEPPTLETVEFIDRKTGENVPLDSIPPIIFSETMRDLDLVVSVAHVGGVDPEASHSTVEMRMAIAAELVKLLKLSNVSWLGSHAKIRGKLASYSVHMGSGVVHAEGIGMVSILPVHSQTRGRIFLPFADDDPKTAEIMSKILLLSEDHKIKDPTILSQISR